MLNKSNGETIYLIECHCGEEIAFDCVPDWFKCPNCEKCISLFKMKK